MKRSTGVSGGITGPYNGTLTCQERKIRQAPHRLERTFPERSFMSCLHRQESLSCSFQGRQDLGQFSDPIVAAKAHDVALLKLLGKEVTAEMLNFPPTSYNTKASRDLKQAPVSELLASLHRYGKFGEKRNSRCCLECRNILCVIQ